MRRETFDVDEIPYEINVSEDEGGFIAQWTCLTCERSGSVPYACPTTAEAIGRAKGQLIADHHVMAHRGAGRSRRLAKGE